MGTDGKESTTKLGRLFNKVFGKEATEGEPAPDHGVYKRRRTRNMTPAREQIGRIPEPA